MSDIENVFVYERASRVLAGEASDQELVEHDAWLESDYANSVLWDEMRQTWNVATDSLRYSDINVNRAWKSVNSKIAKTSEKKYGFSLLYKYSAASIIVIVVIASLFWMIYNPETDKQIELVVDAIAFEELQLSDGSKVFLNKNSKLTCSQPFMGNERTVGFTGEGYFSVAKNENLPFVIETDELIIRVLGTEFNLFSYPHQNLSTIDVSHGLVQVLVKSNPEINIYLEAGTRAGFYKESQNLVKSAIDINASAWKTGEIKFHNTPVYDVIALLERLYNVKIIVADQSILDERMGAAFSHNSLDYILDVVCITFALDYKLDNDTVFLSRK